VRHGPARARRAIGRALLLPILLVPTALAVASVSHAQTKKAIDATPTPAKTSTREPTSTRSTTAKITTPSRGGIKARAGEPPAPCSHTVRNGESVGSIAARYRVTRAAVVGANRLDNPHALRTGQRLAIPGCRPSAPTAKDEGPTVLSSEGSVLKRVGPLRVLTELVLVQPDFQEERIALAWPVEGPVISTFGRRARGWHAGIDITADMGSQILAAAPGTVLYSGWIRAYGQIVKIQHSNGFITLYAHNLKNLVEEGEEVEAGQVIATVGRSGHASGPHLHFEVRRHGKAYNPLHVLEPSDQSPIFDDDVAASSSDLDSHE
jgi:LysM repeat protein/biotin carboxyl carrier protein